MLAGRLASGLVRRGYRQLEDLLAFMNLNTGSLAANESNGT